MGSKVNQGILVDEEVSAQCRGGRYSFKSLPPVKAKGYDKPVPILEPEILSTLETKKKRQNVVAFVGRKMEKRAIHSIAQGILEEPEVAQSTMVFLTGDSGFGKVRLLLLKCHPAIY
jgi:chromosomal replication initiation ATPase DnaA